MAEREPSRDEAWMQMVIHLLLTAFSIGVGVYAAGTIPMVQAARTGNVAVLWAIVGVNTFVAVVEFALACRKARMGRRDGP